MAKSRLAGVSTDLLSTEIRRRQRKLPKLRAKHQKLVRELESLEAEISELGGAAPGRPGRRGAVPGRKRPKNDMPLSDVLAKILKKNKPMKVSAITAAALKAGYKTNADNFSTIVNQTLIKDERFKSSERGYYVLA